MRIPTVVALSLFSMFVSSAHAGETVLATVHAQGRATALHVKVKKVGGYSRAFNRAVDKLYETADLAYANTPNAKRREVSITRVKHFKAFGMSHVKIEADINIVGDEAQPAEIGFKASREHHEVERP